MRTLLAFALLAVAARAHGAAVMSARMTWRDAIIVNMQSRRAAAVRLGHPVIDRVLKLNLDLPENQAKLERLEMVLSKEAALAGATPETFNVEDRKHGAALVRASQVAENSVGVLTQAFFNMLPRLEGVKEVQFEPSLYQDGVNLLTKETLYMPNWTIDYLKDHFQFAAIQHEWQKHRAYPETPGEVARMPDDPKPIYRTDISHWLAIADKRLNETAKKSEAAFKKEASASILQLRQRLEANFAQEGLWPSNPQRRLDEFYKEAHDLEDIIIRVSVAHDIAPFESQDLYDLHTALLEIGLLVGEHSHG